jgi:hypothetical protein
LIFNPVEVVDTFSAGDMHSITGAAAPQGVVYVREIDRLFVANGTDGKLSGARTGSWYEKRDRFYLAVPASSKKGAALWLYAPED